MPILVYVFHNYNESNETFLSSVFMLIKKWD